MHPANKMPGCYGLHSIYDKKLAAKNKVAESVPRKQPSLFENLRKKTSSQKD